MSKRAERLLQCAVMQWVWANENRYPPLRTVFAIPNGAVHNSREGHKLKAEGLKPGVHDLMLPVPLCNFSGLWLELKIEPNRLTDTQLSWRLLMIEYGHAVRTCYTFEQATTAFKEYCSGTLKGQYCGSIDSKR